MSALRALWTALSALQWDRAPSSVGCDVPRDRGLAQLGTERAAEQPAARAPLTSPRGSWGTQVCMSRWEASARLAHWSDHPPQTRNSDFWSYTIPLHPNLCSPLIFFTNAKSILLRLWDFLPCSHSVNSTHCWQHAPRLRVISVP